MQLEQHHRLPRSDWGRKIYDEGFVKGLAEGETLGQAKGEITGQVKGRASAILSLLVLRGLSVDLEHRERIKACTDFVLLDLWLLRAATADTIEEVFAA